ncbi:MAG TPA: ABC transporter permease [Candidatus Acidoferrales bacterium]|nr:ABC transporter permease [Candidatus Acidoferrales bacterium]
MSSRSSIWRRASIWFWALVRRGKLESELDAELRFDLERRIAAKLRAGVNAESARLAALQEFGGVELAKEECRDARGTRLLEQFWQDARFGLRVLRKSPGFTAVAVLTLALGIGATTAIFSVVNAVLLRPLPYPNQNRLVRVEEMHPGSQNASFTFASFLDVARESKAIENISAYRPWSFNLTGDAEPEQVPGALVSANFFSALGSKPYLGRMIGIEDDQPDGANHVAVLSYALWQIRFGANAGIVGRTIQVNAQDFTVIGVMPPDFSFPEGAKIWCPLVPGGSARNNRRAHLLTVIADLRRGESLGAAQGELGILAARIEKQNPGVDPEISISAVSLKNSLVAPVRPALLILISAVSLLQFIACANVANLLLARATSRTREIAIRLSLGASRARVARQLLTESIIVALLGGALGFAVASWSLRFITAINGKDMPRFGEINLDWRVLIFTLGLSFFSALLFGMAPVLGGIKLDLSTSLKKGASISAHGARHGSSSTLVVLQFALAMVLLVGAGLLGNTFMRLLRVGTGFNPENLLTMQFFLSPVEFPEGDLKTAVVLQQMLEGVRSVPGVRSAGVVSALPILGGPDTDFVIQGRPAPPLNDEPSADIRSVDPGYFRAMAIPLLSGREFSEMDSAKSARVMIINETMARTFWPNESPLGQRVTMKDWGPPLTGEIVGVVGDIKTDGLAADVRPMIYWPYFQFPVIFDAFVIRTDGDPLSVVSSVKARVWSVDRNLPFSSIETMQQVLSDSLAQRRLYMILVGVFAGAALLLAAVGIYGLMAYSVSQRTNELGIRMALGAQRTDVLRLVLRQGMRLALIGTAVGIAAALLLTRLMSTLLYGVKPTDPLTFAGVAALLSIVALIACCIPARRATQVQPMTALRNE